MTAPPEQRIREHLERKGGSTTVELGRLLSTFGLGADADRAARVEVAEALASVGVLTVPPVESTPSDVVVRVEVADEATLAAQARRRAAARFDEPPEVVASRARARERARVSDSDSTPERGARAAQQEDEPVEIPPGLPRALLAGGAAAVLVSLFLPWFTGRRGGIEIPDLSTGWEWLSVLDVVLLVVAAAAVALLLVRAGQLAATIVAVSAAFAMGGVLYRIVAPPDDALAGFVLEMSRGVGPFVALLGLLALVAGAGLLASPAREGTITPDGQATGAPAT